MAGLGGSVAGAAFGGPPRPVEQTNYAQGSLLHPGLQALISQLAAMRARLTFSGPPRPVGDTNYMQASNRAALLNAVDRFNRGAVIDQAPQLHFGQPFYAGAPEDWGKLPDAGWYAGEKIPTPLVYPHPMSEFAPQVVPSRPTGASTPKGPQPNARGQLLALARVSRQRATQA